jgi:hypothetical protein
MITGFYMTQAMCFTVPPDAVSQSFLHETDLDQVKGRRIFSQLEAVNGVPEAVET